MHARDYRDIIGGGVLVAGGLFVVLYATTQLQVGTLARMGPVPRNSENATAKACRSGLLQIVLSRPGVSNGALAAPLLSPQGCIGSLSAEIMMTGISRIRASCLSDVRTS